MPAAEPVRLALTELFDHPGTDQLGYSERCTALCGALIEVEAFVVRSHDQRQWLLVDQPGACPDCAAAPVAAMQLPGYDPAAAPDPSAPVRMAGRLSYGFAIGPNGDASFLRLEQAALIEDKST